MSVDSLADYIGFRIINVGKTDERVVRKKEPNDDDAMRILRERYAKGEIDFDTYEKMKNDLK